MSSKLKHALISIAFLIAYNPETQSQTRREIWNQPTTPFRIIGNIYYVGTSGLLRVD